MAMSTMATRMITNTENTAMTDTAILRLMSWLSPVFPTGSFAYSAGLEQAVAEGSVRDAAGLGEWLETMLMHGAWWNDAVLFAAAWRADGDGAAIGDIAALGEALTGSRERYRETMDQGKAFAAAARHWFKNDTPLPDDLPLPVIVGLACGRTGIGLEPALCGYLNTTISNQLHCAIRLSVTGQDGAARLLSELEPVIAGAAARAAGATLDDLGGCAIAAEIAVMNHETLQPRLFLS